jgi:predicted ATPase/signal transduction histidine kinase
MEAGGMLPSGNPPVRAEAVHESERTRVTRLFLAERTVIRKEPLGPDAEHRLRHETAILDRLRGVGGVAQLPQAPRYPGSIVLEDAGGTSLAWSRAPLAAADLTGLALELARAVAGMHCRGVIHRDITPANIVLSRDGSPCLVDFALATSLAEMRPEFTHHTEIAGTLAYLAPEQMGRTGRPVDQRADLYALGATLYELATGAPPFGTGDPLQLIHDHLARVPAPPADVNPAVPARLSGIIMHLLEKEPDNRYQTADGVIYDLERARDARTHPENSGPRVGEHDVPLRLLPPSRLVGRDDEVAALEAALEAALASRCRGVLVSGAPGVGKTALVDQLRPVVTGKDGWFLAGKFDQYRRDLEFDAGYQVFRALGRLLLAEPEDELVRLREQILRAAGPNAGLLAAILPEFAALLAVPPDPGDPLTSQARANRAAAAALRAVASRKRPVVLFLDDLQWAGRTPLGLVDIVLSEEPIEGLLLVGAYRGIDVDAAHPLAARLSRWLGQATVRHLRLVNLPGPSLVTMVAEMLRADQPAAAGLAGLISAYTSGNPYETVELLNALRRDGMLTATAAGWRWDSAAVRAHLGRSEVAGLVAGRVDALPPISRQMLEAMACLGGRAELSLLQPAAAASASAVDGALAPALAEGLLVMEPGAHPAVQFRHDRIREAILGRLDPPRRRALQLSMARRLARVPELFAVAAEQYLAVDGAVDDDAERRDVVALLRRAASQATLIGDYALVDALLAAALRLIDPGETATLVEVHTGRHAALYGLGRLEEADEEYRTIEGLSATALDRANATAVQVRSLTHRKRFAESIGLGIGSLRELGIAVGAADRGPTELDQQFGHLYRWLDDTGAADDVGRPDVTEPRLLAASRLIDAVLPPVYFTADHATLAWLSLEALRIWLEHGPSPALIGPASHTAFVAVTLRGDYAAGSRAMRRILALGEARGYQPGTSHARFVFALLACWFGPLESGVHAGQRAREGLIAGGDMANGAYSYHPTVYYLLDCAPSLDACVAEVESGLAFVRRTGNEEAGQWLDSCRRLAAVLRGESAAPADEAVPIDRYADNPLALLHAHLGDAIAAAIFDDLDGLARHAAAAIPLLPAALGLYPTAVGRLLHGLALARQARMTNGDERGGLLSQLDDVTRWLAARAADAPDNFLHLLRWLEAERAWAAGDFRAAVIAFDAALREVAGRQRPWHRALIAERTGRFYLAHGADHIGSHLLAQARHEYAAWGATAKVAQLDWSYPALRPPADAAAGGGADQPAGNSGRPSGHRATVMTGTIDLLGILSASQALSSETSIDRLHARVAEVLRSMTGATRVQLLLWDEDRQDWLLPASGSGAGPVSGAGHERAGPMSVLRYLQRTREPLVAGDVTRDDRFARDPYFADVDCCSLLALPVLSRGVLRAVLLLENQLIRGAFTTGRLDAVSLLAGQLAVSLDNAQLYAGFRRMADEQAALRRVATLVAQTTPPEEVFAAVAEEVGGLLEVDYTVLIRSDPEDMITVVGAWTATGVAPPSPVGSRFDLGGRNVSTLTLRTGRPARLDAYVDVTGSIGNTGAHAWGFHSSVGVPISVEGRPWGLILVAYTRKQQLSADTEAQLSGFTGLIATAIANTQARMESRGFAEEQAALRRVATAVARGASPQEVFAAVAEEAGQVIPGADFALVSRYDAARAAEVVGGWARAGSRDLVGLRAGLGGRTVSTLVFERNEPARVDHLPGDDSGLAIAAQEHSVRSSVGAPISIAGRPWGLMIVTSTRQGALPAGAEHRLAGFTELVATAIANAESQAALAASRARIMATADQTRRSIERDLHDGAQQRLVSLALHLRAAQAVARAEPGELSVHLAGAIAEAAGALEELRETARGIHPAILATSGLRPALRTLARRSPIPVDLRVDAIGRLPEPIEVSAYYVAAEALTNVAKHARASSVRVEVEVAGEILRVAVRDDGCGGADFTGGTGLVGLKDRVEAIGGQIFLDSPQGAGTSLRAELPVTAATGGVTIPDARLPANGPAWGQARPRFRGRAGLWAGLWPGSAGVAGAAVVVGGEGGLDAAEYAGVGGDQAEFPVVVQRVAGEVLRAGEDLGRGGAVVGHDRLGVDVEAGGRGVALDRAAAADDLLELGGVGGGVFHHDPGLHAALLGRDDRADHGAVAELLLLDVE